MNKHNSNHLSDQGKTLKRQLREKISAISISDNLSERDRIFSSFLEWMPENVNVARFDRLRRSCFSEYEDGSQQDYLKYINPISWSEAKFNCLYRYGIHQRRDESILDIGTGPGHLQLISKFFGFDVVGTEIPNLISGTGAHAKFYCELSEAFHLSRVPLKIEPFRVLSLKKQKFSLITAFMAAFNIDENDEAWTPEHWEYFLSDLRDNFLQPGGSILFSLTRRKTSVESWAYLSSMATLANEQLYELYFEDLGLAMK